MLPVPPPLPSDFPSSGHPAAPPRQTPKELLQRNLGDLSAEEIAALLPPEDENEDDLLTDPRSVSQPPPIPSGKSTASIPIASPPPISGKSVPPPPPTGSQEIVAFVPPPIQGEATEPEEEETPFPKKKYVSSYWKAQKKTLLYVLFASLLVCGLLILLTIFLSPDRWRPTGADSNSEGIPPVVENAPSVPKTPTRRVFDTNNAAEIDFIDPNESEGED